MNGEKWQQFNAVLGKTLQHPVYGNLLSGQIVAYRGTCPVFMSPISNGIADRGACDKTDMDSFTIYDKAENPVFTRYLV